MINRYKFTSTKNKQYGLTFFKDIPDTMEYYTIMLKQNDRLDLLADRLYGSVDYWWIFAVVNPNVIKPDSIIIGEPVQVKIVNNLQGFIRYYRSINNG